MSFGIVAGVVGSVAGAVITSRATKKAGEAQKAGTDGAIEEQGRQYDLTRADFARPTVRRGSMRCLNSLVTSTSR